MLRTETIPIPLRKYIERLQKENIELKENREKQTMLTKHELRNIVHGIDEELYDKYEDFLEFTEKLHDELEEKIKENLAKMFDI